jgi:hypothetical protein
MVFHDSGGNTVQIRGPGDGKLVNEKWQVSCNWREVEEPRGDGVLEKSWIPPGPRDVRNVSIAVLSRTPIDVNFLRPAKDSPLASAGAGKEDTSLPTYVGAVPPEGGKPWDWQTTWDARHPKMLLTVSKDPKDGGEFRTINDALTKVTRPRMTIRVLDDASYAESLVLDNPARHEGLWLDAPKHARIEPPADAGRAVSIRNVSAVRIRGFRLPRGAGPYVFVHLTGHCPGVQLEQLDIQGKLDLNVPSYGITVQNLRIAQEEEPLIISECKLQGVFHGIVVSGGAENPTRGVCIRNNRLTLMGRGIVERSISR